MICGEEITVERWAGGGEFEFEFETVEPAEAAEARSRKDASPHPTIDRFPASRRQYERTRGEDEVSVDKLVSSFDRTNEGGETHR